MTNLNSTNDGMSNDGNNLDDDGRRSSWRGVLGDDNVAKNMFVVEEPRILQGDIVTILMTAQLLGLVDVLSDATFWSNGGFMQPIPAIPSTLSTLVQRDSIMSIAWVLSGLKNGGYVLSAVADDITAFKSALTIWTDYCSLLVLFGLGMGLVTHTAVDGWDLLRQCWFTIVMLSGFRFLYGRYNR